MGQWTMYNIQWMMYDEGREERGWEERMDGEDKTKGINIEPMSNM